MDVGAAEEVWNVQPWLATMDATECGHGPLNACEACSMFHGTRHADNADDVDGLLGMRAPPFSVALDRQGAETQHVFGLSFGGEVYVDPLERRHKL